MTIVAPCDDEHYLFGKIQNFFKNDFRRNICKYLDEYFNNNKSITIKTISNYFLITTSSLSYQIIKSFEMLKLLKCRRPNKSKRDYYLINDIKIWSYARDYINELEIKK